MSDTPLVTYKGNCHCGAFQFSFNTPEIKTTTTCNCSMCSKVRSIVAAVDMQAHTKIQTGYMWAAFRGDENFKILKGDESALTTYNFGKGLLTHKFCATCGTSILARQKDPSLSNGVSLLVNIRTVTDGIDFAALEPGFVFNGAAIGDPYQEPAHVPIPDGADTPENAVVYHGACHCGDVAYTMQNPGKITSAMECNCSICWRDAGVWVYPKTSYFTFRGVPDAVTEYTFGNGVTFHAFCKKCGVAMYERFLWEPFADKTAVSVRTIEGLKMADIEVEKWDGRTHKGLYVCPA
ncbi:Glutathione-dependent formaldehyde-activating [Mycena kentingensis (nom. inval.)]|nr:Glutathione-dependent formaldehyde-activating [Mycena kentingensis (nom. inval.)]